MKNRNEDGSGCTTKVAVLAAVCENEFGSRTHTSLAFLSILFVPSFDLFVLWLSLCTSQPDEMIQNAVDWNHWIYKL